jgi:hypothetical protein
MTFLSDCGLGSRVLIALLMAGTFSASANESTSCYSITDHDRRAACLAEAKKDRGGCFSIKDHDKRAMCQAKTSGDKSVCYSIHDHNERNACQAGMGW